MPLIIVQAEAKDDAQVTDCVCRAFLPYILQIGKQPQPMLDNYQELIKNHRVTLARKGQDCAGVLVIDTVDRLFTIDTLAVHPAYQGTGVGHHLIKRAEHLAREAGHASIYLSTNRVMTQAQQIYLHLGFELYDERFAHGYDRLYFRKSLAV